MIEGIDGDIVGGILSGEGVIGVFLSLNLF